ncbi:hypothetical protein [Pseudoalteromonas sp. 5-MNA-CIBAN-0065]
MDRNRAERAIKLFMIDHKAWLLSNTYNSVTILYSLVETASAK